MTQETLQIGGTLGIVIALIELIKFIIGKYAPNGKNGNYEMERQLKLMNENHLHSIQEAIEKQTDVLISQTQFLKDDHNKSLEVLYQIKANTEMALKK